MSQIFRYLIRCWFFGAIGMQTGNRIDKAVTIAMAGFALSAAVLAVLDNLAQTVFPFPGIITTLQCVSGSVIASRLGRMQKTTYREAPQFINIARRLLPAAAVLSLSIFANKELQNCANSETIFVLHSFAIMLVAIGEAIYRKGWRLSKEAVASLLIFIGGAVSYILNDARFILKSRSWATTFLLSKALEMVYFKHLVTAMDMTTWDLVLYSNLLSLMFVPTFAVLNGEASTAKSFLSKRPVSHHRNVAVTLTVLCLLSTTGAFYEYQSLKAASATTCTMIDALSQLPFALINAIFLQQETASCSGILSLLICIIGAVMYCQFQTDDHDACTLLPISQSDFIPDSTYYKSSDDGDNSD